MFLLSLRVVRFSLHSKCPVSAPSLCHPGKSARTHHVAHKRPLTQPAHSAWRGHAAPLPSAQRRVVRVGSRGPAGEATSGHSMGAASPEGARRLAWHGGNESKRERVEDAREAASRKQAPGPRRESESPFPCGFSSEGRNSVWSLVSPRTHRIRLKQYYRVLIVLVSSRILNIPGSTRWSTLFPFVSRVTY